MLEKLLAAIERLTAALETAAANPPAAKAATGGKKAAEKPADLSAGVQQPTTATQPIQASTAQPAQAAVTAGPSSAAAGPTPETVGKSMVEVANQISRDAAIGLMAKYGASGFGAVKIADHPAFYVEAQQLLAIAAKYGEIKSRTPEQQAALVAEALAFIKPPVANAAAGLM